LILRRLVTKRDLRVLQDIGGSTDIRFFYQRDVESINYFCSFSLPLIGPLRIDSVHPFETFLFIIMHLALLYA